MAYDLSCVDSQSRSEIVPYTKLLILGFLQAIFFSGGVYWRVPLSVGILPEFREELRPVLEAMSLYHLPDWYFYLFAAVFAALVFAGHIAWLEVPRVRFSDIVSAPHEGDVYIRLPIENTSWREVNIVVRMWLKYRDGTQIRDNPLVLLTQQRLGRRNATKDFADRTRFKLSDEEKNLEIAIIDMTSERMRIEHENGAKELPLGDYWLEVKAYGAGISVIFLITMTYDSGVLKVHGKNHVIRLEKKV